MKKTITKLVLALGLVTSFSAEAQTTATFDTFTLSPNSYYQDNSGTDFQSGNSIFRYGWSGWWSSGSAYTNKADTIDGTYTNLYGAITYSAYTGSNYATLQNGATIAFTNSVTAVSGFYITNTTYAWKSVKKGDMFARKFGDTTGTNCGGLIAQGEYPDWFKVLVKGYKNGSLLTDSVEFYLADYRAAGTANDYAVKTWQYVDCSSLGTIDSLTFVMKSSDTGQWGMNTPAFFAIDDFTTMLTTNVKDLEQVSNISVYPNPTNNKVFVNYNSKIETELTVNIYDVAGKTIFTSSKQNVIGENNFKLETASLEAGIYFVELNDGLSSKKIKFIKL